MEATHHLTFAPDALETHSTLACQVRQDGPIPVELVDERTDPDNGHTYYVIHLPIRRGVAVTYVHPHLGARLVAIEAVR